MFAVSSYGNSTAVQTFFNNKYVMSPPKAIPPHTFPDGLNNIKVTICNFFGMCGVGSFQLIVTNAYVSLLILFSLLFSFIIYHIAITLCLTIFKYAVDSNAPVVTIAGGNLLQTTSSAGLTLNADAFVSSCDGNGKTI